MQRGQEPGAGTGTCRRKSAGAGTGAETGQRGREAGGRKAGGRKAGGRKAGGRAPGRGQERRQASGAEGRGTSAGAGTGAEAIKGAERGQRGRKAAGERAPEVTENDVVLPRKGSIPVRQCPRAACSPATPLRQLPPPLRRDATPSAHRPAALYHPSLHTSANFPSPAPPRGLFLPRSARSCSLPEGPKRPPAGPGTGSHRPNTHNRPIARTRTKKERHPLPDAAPWNGCAVSTRGRRPYRPLRAGRRTRPAYWPQSSPLRAGP